LYDYEAQVFRPVSLISRLRSEYGKEMPISSATCIIEPGNSWIKSPELIEISKPEFTQPRKEARFVITMKRSFTLKEFEELIKPRIPLQLRVTLFPTPSPVSGASGVPMLPPQTDIAMLTIPEIPPGKIVFDHPVTEFDELHIDQLNPKGDRSLPVVTVKARLEPSHIFPKDNPDFFTIWKEKIGGISSIQASGKNPIIETIGAAWNDDEWTYQKFRCNQVPEYGKPLTAGVEAIAFIFGSKVIGNSSITFNPSNKYILNLSSNEVRLTGSEGSFSATLIDETSKEPYIVPTGQISVSVPPDAERFLSVSPRETRTGQLTCKIIRIKPTTVTSIPLKISARVGQQSLPQTPTVMVYLGEKKYRILCTPPEAVVFDMKKYPKKKDKSTRIEASFIAEIEVFDHVAGRFVPAEQESIKGKFELNAYKDKITIQEGKEKPNRYTAKVSISPSISLKNEAETVGSFSVWAEKPLQGLEKVVIPIQVLKEKPPKVELVVTKRGFAPVTVNITEKNPALAATLGSDGGVIKIPKIQGILELEGITLKEDIEYATGVLRIGETEYSSAPDEKSLQIVVKKEGATHPYGDAVLLTFDDQEIKSKIAGIQQDLKNFPSEANAKDFTPELKEYSKKCLELFAREKNTLLEDQGSKPGLASVYAGRIGKTWAFIRFAKDIYPLLGRTEKLTQQSFSRATENLVDFFIQFALAVTPWAYEKIRQSRGSTAPSLEDLKPMAKEVVEGGLKTQLSSVKENLTKGITKLTNNLITEFKLVHENINGIDDIIRKNNHEILKYFKSELKDKVKDLSQDSAKNINDIIDSFPSAPIHPFPTNYLQTSDPYEHFTTQLKTWSKQYKEYQKNSIDSITSLHKELKDLKLGFEHPSAKYIRLLEKEFELTSKSLRNIGEQAKKIDGLRTTNTILSEIDELLKNLMDNPSIYTPSKIGEKIDLIQKKAQESLKSFKDLKTYEQYKELVDHHNEMLNSLKASLPKEDAEKLIAAEITEQQNWNEVKTKLVEICDNHLLDIIPDVAKSPEMMELIRILKEIEARKEPYHFHFDEFGVEEYIPIDELDKNSFKKVEVFKIYLQTMQAGAEVASSFLEAMGKTMNNLTLNISKMAYNYRKTLSYQSYFSDESVSKVKEHLKKYECNEKYFGMDSKVDQISELAEKLYKKPLEPILSKEMIPQKRNEILSDFEKNDKRNDIISNVFHQAVIGSLGPDTLVKAPDVTAEDLGVLRSHLNTISENVLSFEQAFARAESLKQLPFYQRWYRYVTEDLGSAMEGGTSADADQVIEWFAWVGSIAFMICSIILPIFKVVQAGTMALRVAQKDIIDIFTSAIRFIASCFSTLDVVSNYYRDLLVLFGITYIGFYEGDVEFESILKRTTEPDPNEEFLFGPLSSKG